jgi:uncharacterized protein YjdB
MPLTIIVGGTATAAPPAYQEWTGPSGTGTSIAPAGPLTYASDTPAVATVDANGDVVGVAAGTANITTSDSTNGLSATDVLTVSGGTPPAAVSATLNLAATSSLKGGSFRRR